MQRFIPLLILCTSAAFAAEDSQTGTALVAPVFSPMAPKSPAAQRYLKWQNRGMVLKQYDGVDEALRLTPQETAKLYDLLADQMNRGRFMPRMALNDIAAMKKQAEEQRAANDAEIAKLIGQNRLPLWRDFQESLVFRAQAQNVRDQLQMMGVPLTDEQRTQLLDLFLQDRQMPYGPQLNETLSVEERIAQSNQWQDEHDRKLLERLKPVLTAEQSARYGDYQAYMAEMRTSFQTFRQTGPGGGVVSGGVIQQGIIQGAGGNSLQFRSMLMPGQMVAPAPAAPPPPANAASPPASK